MKKLLTIFFFSAFFFSGISVFAANSGSKLFLDTVIDEKKTIETMYDSSYNDVYQKFQTSVVSVLNSLNYQSLVCLGVMSDTLFLNQMQNDSKNLKLGFLNSYALLYADALDIEQKSRILKDTAVSLFASGTSYQTEQQRILNSLTQLTASHKELAAQFKQSYELKIKQFLIDVQDYSQKNKDLLVTIGSRVQMMKNIEQQYQKLSSDLISYQSKLSGTGAVFFSKLPILKQASTSGLNVSFQNIITKEVKKYPILPSLSGELLQQKTYALGLFEMQVDEKINLLLSQRYDNKEFTQIKNSVEQLFAKYGSNGHFQCSSLLSSESFASDADALLKKITTFSASFGTKLSSNNKSSTGFQQTISQRFNLITQLQKESIRSFTLVVQQKEKTLLDQLKQQRESKSPTQVQPEAQPSQQSTGIIVPSKPTTSTSFTFTRAFKKGEKHSDIAVLQQLLASLGYYKLEINSVYTKETIQAVYDYQLAKNLLKGYEKRPQTWGWMGPSTRNQLTQDLAK